MCGARNTPLLLTNKNSSIISVFESCFTCAQEGSAGSTGPVDSRKRGREGPVTETQVKLESTLLDGSAQESDAEAGIRNAKQMKIPVAGAVLLPPLSAVSGWCHPLLQYTHIHIYHTTIHIYESASFVERYPMNFVHSPQQESFN